MLTFNEHSVVLSTENGHQYKCFVRNTSLVLDNINSSTVILLQKQHYIYILFIYFSNMKPYDGHKMQTI